MLKQTLIFAFARLHFEHCETIRSMKCDCVVEKHGLLLSVTAIKMHAGGRLDQKWQRDA